MPGFGSIGELAVDEAPTIVTPRSVVFPVPAEVGTALDGTVPIMLSLRRGGFAPPQKIIQPISLYSWTDADDIEDY